MLLEADGGERQLTILATGSELRLAVQARPQLQAKGVRTAVVSMPCRLLFEAQSPDYKQHVLGPRSARVAVEAAVQDGWDRYLGFDGRFVGMRSFGASGKIDDVYKKFGITVDDVVKASEEAMAVATR